MGTRKIFVFTSPVKCSWHLRKLPPLLEFPTSRLPVPSPKLFHFTGYCFTKPEVIFRLEQGEEPWILEEEFPSQRFPGELVGTVQMDIEGSVIFLWLIRRLITWKYFFKNTSLEVPVLGND